MEGAVSVQEALEMQKRRIRQALERSARAPGAARLLAVSKKQSVEAIREAYAAGQRDFGENYAQELVQKAEELRDLPELRLHMIGHLQSNKAKLIVQTAHSIQSVDSISLAKELNKHARDKRPGHLPKLEVLIEVNIGREPQKHGALPEDVPALVAAIRELPHLTLKGLMCIPPAAENAEESRPFFRALAELRAELGGEAALPELSMGMSQDVEVAVEEGATWVRIGTAIFGARPA